MVPEMNDMHATVVAQTQLMHVTTTSKKATAHLAMEFETGRRDVYRHWQSRALQVEENRHERRYLSSIMAAVQWTYGIDLKGRITLFMDRIPRAPLASTRDFGSLKFVMTVTDSGVIDNYGRCM